jgi:hypothetical protein
MVIVNKKTGEHIDVTSVNTQAGLFYAKYKANPVANEESKSFTFESDDNLKEWMDVFSIWLLTQPGYVDWVEKRNFIDWPTDSELPEHNMNYRLHLSKDQLIKLLTTKQGVEVINKFYAEGSTMQQRNIGDDKYVYMTNIPNGDAFGIMFLLGGLDAVERQKVALQFTKNPYKPEIDDIDFNPSPEMQSYIDSLLNPIVPEEGGE